MALDTNSRISNNILDEGKRVIFDLWLELVSLRLSLCIRFTVLASISLSDTSKQATLLIVLLLIERNSTLTNTLLNQAARADYQEYTIAKKDFKNLYPSDFEDLNLLLLQGHLNRISSLDRCMLSTAVNLWTRNLVIRQRVEDFQLGIESYQKQLNLTKSGWEAKGFEYKHDYTIIESPRAVVFPFGNNERKIIRVNEIYKFSDGTLTNIMEALDYRVKEYKNIRVIPKYHSEDGNPARANIKQALGRSSQDLEVQVKMEMEIPHSSGVYFITACSYSTNTSKDLMKAQVYVSKLPQLLPLK
ncbi:hypothetical protein Tco_0296493 [Tanacetum coccineum]